jgi:hypothetical protein
VGLLRTDLLWAGLRGLQGRDDDDWTRFTKDMEKDLYGAQKRVWKMLRNKKKPVSEYVQTNKIAVREWENYFQSL